MLAATSAAAEAPTRAEYVAQLEQICKPGSEATQRAVRGMRADVRSERLRLAATKVAKAKRIFAGTVRAISTVPRPGGRQRHPRRAGSPLSERETVYARPDRRRPARRRRRPLPARLGRLHPRGEQGQQRGRLLRLQLLQLQALEVHVSAGDARRRRLSGRGGSAALRLGRASLLAGRLPRRPLRPAPPARPRRRDSRSDCCAPTRSPPIATSAPTRRGSPRSPLLAPRRAPRPRSSAASSPTS